MFTGPLVLPEVNRSPNVPTMLLFCLMAKVFPFHPFDVLVMRIVSFSVAGALHGVAKQKVVSVSEAVKGVPAVLSKRIAPVGDFTVKPTSDEADPSYFTIMSVNLLFSTQM